MGRKLGNDEPLDGEPLVAELVDPEPEYGVNAAPGGGGLMGA